MEAKSTNHHAVFLPLALQGHVNPLVHFSLKLASKGFTITFLVFEHIHQQIAQARPDSTESDDIFERARAGPGGLDIRYRVVSDGLPLDFDRTVRLEESLGWYLHGGMYDLLEKVMGELVFGSRPKVNVLVADTFYPWASKVAKKFGLRYFSFWTEPALVFNQFYHIDLLREHGHYDCPENRKDPIDYIPGVQSINPIDYSHFNVLFIENRKDPIDYIPGVQSINPKDLTSYLQDTDTTTNMHKLFYQAFQDVRSANCVLCNTVQDLEPECILALQNLMPFYPIGPILLSGPTKSIVPTSFWAESSCTEWLGSKAHGSVLYVSFGSLANFSKSDLLEIAYGLLLSDVDFVWVLRARTVLDEDNDVLPVGFEEKVRGRGIIVPWTDQIAVLSHSAIYGFLTHCGWNSVLESIWCEIPMLCFPVFTDQVTNRKLVVDDWKVGINLCDEKPIRREKIVIQINSFMSHKIGDELRRNMKGVKNVLENALEANGSSEKNIDLFIEKLKE